MAIFRLNHAVLYVSDITRSVEFYREVLGFRVRLQLAGAAFLQAPDSTNDHDLGLFEVGNGKSSGRRPGLYHLAWELDTLDELAKHAERLVAAGALTGSADHGTTKSLYASDPDGIEFEVVWIVPAHLLDETARAASAHIRPLDLERERARYGGDTRGGLGVSVPLGVELPVVTG